MKLYLLNWGNGMIGGFHGKDLHQIFNTSKNLLFACIEQVIENYNVISIEIEIIHSHDELNKMRQDMGLDIRGYF